VKVYKPIFFCLQKNVIWSEMRVGEMRAILQEIAWDLEKADPNARMRALRILLYILQVQCKIVRI
jgi:hypothetical protein